MVWKAVAIDGTCSCCDNSITDVFIFEGDYKRIIASHDEENTFKEHRTLNIQERFNAQGDCIRIKEGIKLNYMEVKHFASYDEMKEFVNEKRGVEVVT